MSETIRKDNLSVVARGVRGSAEAANVSEKTIRNELKAKRLRHARLGNKILILDSDLRAWVESRIVESYQPMREYVPPYKPKQAQ